MANWTHDKPYALGTYHMVGKDGYEPQRTNNFELLIFLRQATDINGTTTGVNWPHMFSSNSDGVSTEQVPRNVTQLLTLSVNDFSAPNFDLSVLEVSYGNNKVKYAGVPNFGSGSVNFNDFLGIETERLLMAWFKEGYNVRTQKVGRARNYKKTAWLVEYDPAGVFARKWLIGGCWISSLDLGSFAQDNNSVRKISCTFQYDYCYPLDNNIKYKDTSDVNTEKYPTNNGPL